MFHFFRYKAAQEIDNQVKQMSGDIKEIVNNLNKANSKKESDDDVSYSFEQITF